MSLNPMLICSKRSHIHIYGKILQNWTHYNYMATMLDFLKSVSNTYDVIKQVFKIEEKCFVRVCGV